MDRLGKKLARLLEEKKTYEAEQLAITIFKVSDRFFFKKKVSH
jgi:hypothetical protein